MRDANPVWLRINVWLNLVWVLVSVVLERLPGRNEVQAKREWLPDEMHSVDICISIRMPMLYVTNTSNFQSTHRSLLSENTQYARATDMHA